MMPQNVRLLEENVGGVGISARDADSRHRKGQMRRGILLTSYSYSDGSPSQPIVSSQKTNNQWPGARRVEYGHSNPPEKRSVFDRTTAELN
jgi:hypothetical protein